MSAGSGGYPTSAFDYELPPDRIARYPEERRDESRLLVVDRRTGALAHRIFRDLLELVPAGDALVLNETRVFPARLLGRRPGGGEAEVLLLRPASVAASGSELVHPDARVEGEAVLWEALVRPGAKLKPGRVVQVSEELSVEIVDAAPDGTRVVRLVTALPVEEALARYGRIPLPPYLGREAEPADAERYQTVYARQTGSVAAPTAGLHFTAELLAALEQKGVRLVRVVLHVGPGTFRPVEVEDPAEHRMHAEEYAVSPEAAAALNEVRRGGGKLWAVGTTVARTLETVADESGFVRPGSGRTELFIRPPYRFRAVDRLITNFHLPRSTLLMLVAAFGGYELVMRAYREAVERGYRFYSYGDAMLIL
ncbi:MAG TPA: tRNA preQ1(34) S-adenosylmethionine ribosyltransferase-isomerase QueA [Longimicrobiales bacterium]